MFNGDIVGGINEQDLDDVILQLNNKIDSITETLNNVKMKFYDSKDYFKGDVADKFQAQFKAYSDQYELLKDNLNSYVNDLLNVKSMMGKIDESALKKLQEAVDKTIAETQQVIDNNEVALANATVEADISSQKAF